MNSEEQLVRLGSLENTVHFYTKLKVSQQFPLKAQKIDILQINVGRVCNLRCKHCHVEAGPERHESMSKDIFEKCLHILKNSAIGTVDITGGAPEMNRHLEWFIKEVAQLQRRLIVRTNFVILMEQEYEHFIDIYTNNGVEVVGSLPCFTSAQTNQQRGNGVFEKCIAAIRKLNERGYAQEGSGLILDLVHNPVGMLLPECQKELENKYKKQLQENHGVQFSTLFALTNMPVGRYLEFLLKSGHFNDYMELLANSYNPCTVKNVMCRSTISVGWDGKLFDCDFNQMLGIQVNHGAPNHIDVFDLNLLDSREIKIANHCYGCTAGTGSSCQGTTTG